LTERTEPGAGTAPAPSKSQRKRDMTALQALGEALVALSAVQLARIDLPENLRDAVAAARGMTRREAKRRQLQYIGKLMRGVDPEPIRRHLDALRSASREHTARLHRVERWRERLLSDPQALPSLLSEHPGADAQRLRALVSGAQRERAAGAPPRSYRALYRLLAQIVG
jgi:ribosome-associated protein